MEYLLKMFESFCKRLEHPEFTNFETLAHAELAKGLLQELFNNERIKYLTGCYQAAHQDSTDRDYFQREIDKILNPK